MHLSAAAQDKISGRTRGSTGRDEIVDHHYFIALTHSILVNLNGILTVF